LIDKTWPTYHYLPPRVEYIFPRHCYWSHRLTHNPAKYNCHKYTIVYNKRIHNKVEEYYKFPNHNRLTAILGYSPYYNRSNRFVCCIYFRNELLHYMIYNSDSNILNAMNYIITLCRNIGDTTDISYSIGYEPTYGLVNNRRYTIIDKCCDFTPITETSAGYQRLSMLLAI
jgi:hypothetical protein